MNVNIETLLHWTQPVRVDTKNGPRMIRTADAPRGHTFWDVYNANREALRLAGIQAKYIKHDDASLPVYQILWWLPLDPAVIEAERVKREEERIELQEALSGKQAKLTAEQYARFKKIEHKLLPFQIASVRRLVKSLTTYNGALDASDTGTGKTYTALAAAYILDRPVYVVCPKAVRPSWKRAAVHFNSMIIFVCNYELLRRGEQAAVRIVGEGKNEDFQWHLDPTTIIIFDECHRLKDYKTWNCALGLSAIRQGYMVLGLSATAADNPLQMKFSGFLTKLFPEKRFWAWAQASGCKKSRWGMSFEGGSEALNAIHRSIFPLHGTRIRIADLGDAFPETQITAECYDTNGNESKINAVYDEMKDEIARLEAKSIKDTACILVAMLRARQRSEILKVPAIAAMAQDAVEEGMSVAIFVNFDDSADALVAKLKTNCVIRGGQSDKAREENIQAFQDDKQPIIICNIKAGGVGVSLHGSPGKRMRLAIICPTWSGQDLKQALGRVWRAGGVKSLQRIFFAAKTIEERICDQVREKIGRIDLLNDGDLKLNENRAEEVIIDIPEPQPPVTAKAPAAVIPVVDPTEEKKEPGSDKPKKAPTIPPEVTKDTHDALRILAGMCDGARKKDHAGFNAMDSAYGKSLAGQGTLTPRQVIVALKMIRKYARQLPVDLRTRLGITPVKGKESKGTPGVLKKVRSTVPQFNGHSAVAVIRACGVAGWDFKRTRAVLTRLGADVADNTIRIQLNAGRKGTAPAAPVDVAGLERINPVVQ